MEEDDAIENPLIHPCKCSGTMKYIHLGCLKQWIGTQSCVKVDSNEDCCIYLIHKIQCELCKENLPDSIQHNKKIFDIVDFGKDYSNYMTIEALTLDKYKNKYLYVVNLDNDKDIKIGRGHDTNLLLSDISVSRLHCKISKSKNNFFIEDFDSKFGTLILMQNPIFQLNTEIPLNIQIGRTCFSASNTVNSRRSSWAARRVYISALETGGAFRLSRPISAPRTAFISASSKHCPIAITSPVAFICVPKRREEPWNLSKGHLGNFTTT